MKCMLATFVVNMRMCHWMCTRTSAGSFSHSMLLGNRYSAHLSIRSSTGLKCVHLVQVTVPMGRLTRLSGLNWSIDLEAVVCCEQVATNSRREIEEVFPSLE